MLPSPGGRTMIPRLFSWANTIPMGKTLGAAPNGRRAGEPISHGSNPDRAFREDSAPTALAVAVARVRLAYGNTAPTQIDLDLAVSRDQGGVERIAGLIQTHFRPGGTQISISVVDSAQILAARRDLSRFRDLIMRVTGFSAHFASLSPEFRQLVVDRIIAEG